MPTSPKGRQGCRNFPNYCPTWPCGSMFRICTYILLLTDSVWRRFKYKFKEGTFCSQVEWLAFAELENPILKSTRRMTTSRNGTWKARLGPEPHIRIDCVGRWLASMSIRPNSNLGHCLERSFRTNILDPSGPVFRICT